MVDITTQIKNGKVQKAVRNYNITISGDIPEKQIPHIMAFLKYLLSSYKLTLNEPKTKILRQNQKQYITGAVVKKKFPQIQNSRKK